MTKSHGYYGLRSKYEGLYNLVSTKLPITIEKLYNEFWTYPKASKTP
jgi:hypothetical protein